MKATSIFGVVMALSIGALACGGSSGGSGGSTGSGGSSGAGGASGTGAGGTVTASCTTSGVCTQILVPSSGVAGENSMCTGIDTGTPGTGCSTKGIVGCCVDNASAAQEVQCYYSATSASLYQGLCTKSGKTWQKTL